MARTFDWDFAKLQTCTSSHRSTASTLKALHSFFLLGYFGNWRTAVYQSVYSWSSKLWWWKRSTLLLSSQARPWAKRTFIVQLHGSWQWLSLGHLCACFGRKSFRVSLHVWVLQNQIVLMRFKQNYSGEQHLIQLNISCLMKHPILEMIQYISGENNMRVPYYITLPYTPLIIRVTERLRKHVSRIFRSLTSELWLDL